MNLTTNDKGVEMYNADAGNKFLIDGDIILRQIAVTPSGEWYGQEYNVMFEVKLPEGEEVKYTNERLREAVACYFFYESECAGQLFCHSMTFYQNTLSTYGNEGILVIHHRLAV